MSNTFAVAGRSMPNYRRLACARRGLLFSTLVIRLEALDEKRELLSDVYRHRISVRDVGDPMPVGEHDVEDLPGRAERRRVDVDGDEGRIIPEGLGSARIDY